MIYLPSSLTERIAAFSQNGPSNATQLRNNYIQNSNHQNLHRTYLMSRMPATYAAIVAVLQQLPRDIAIQSVLDIGAGPGTGLWAVSEYFSNLEHYLGMEADRSFIQLADQLRPHTPHLHVEWRQGTYPKDLPLSKADMVLMSYTLGENSPGVIRQTIATVWETNVADWLVMVEPGTPKGYQTLMHARQVIIERGGYIAAPCKGNYECPLGQGDWCHFSVRLQRPAFQKKVKDAALTFEDEKYAYLIARKAQVPIKSGQARIIKRPMVRPGHITLDLCSKDPYERITVSKSQKAAYQQAKQADWGDSWDKDIQND